MNNRITTHDEDSVRADPVLPDAQAEPDDDGKGELRVIIRKLEMPVRPRGVLAE